MGGSLDLLGSYIIGGMVLILMTGVILNFQEDARDTVLQEISQVSMAEMSQIMDKEINNLGYRVPGDRKIVALDYRSISFLSDYDNDGIVDTISYAMHRTRQGPVTTRRIAAPGSRPLTWSTRGSMVLFTGYDSSGARTSDPSLIRAVEASMLTSNMLYQKLGSLTGTTSTSGSLSENGSASLQVSHDALLATAVDCQAGAYWHKTIYPKNLTTLPPQIADSTPLGNPRTGGTTGGSDSGDSGGTANGSDAGNASDTGGDTGNAGDTGGDTGDAGDAGTITPPASGDDNQDATPDPDDPCPCGSGKKYRQCCGKS